MQKKQKTNKKKKKKQKKQNKTKSAIHSQEREEMRSSPNSKFSIERQRERDPSQTRVGNFIES